MKNVLLSLLSVGLMLSCATGGPPADTDATTPAAPPAAAPVSDAEIGLAAGTVFEQPPQAPIAFNRIDPGESELRPRPNEEFPPAIPHSIDDLETITLGENSCLDCHAPEAAADMGAPAVPASHQVDLRRLPEVTGTEVVGSRWVCTACHMAQTDTAPLVANTSG